MDKPPMEVTNPGFFLKEIMFLLKVAFLFLKISNSLEASSFPEVVSCCKMAAKSFVCICSL